MQGAIRFLAGMLILLPNLWLCASPYIGDTMVYVDAVVRALSGNGAGPAALWEFGHLLWRPLGFAIAPICFALVPDDWGAAPRVKIAYGFLAVSMVAAMGVASLLFDLFRRLAGWKAAVLLTFGLSWSVGFLNYTLSGSSYIPGLFCEVAAIWLLFEDKPSGRRQILAGVLAALGALFWFPYVLAIPAISAIPWARGRLRAPEGLRVLVRVGAAGGLCLAAGILAGAWLAGLRSPEAAVEWYGEARHNVQQNRQLIRAVSGIPRLMVDLFNDGFLLKRFVFRDPFHPVSQWELVRLSLWKLAAFYTFVLAVVALAIRHERSRPILALLAVSGVPMVLFAVLLFEPSGPERFLPVLPFLFLAAAAGWEGRWRWVAGAFLAALPAINGPLFVEAWSKEQRATYRQIEDYSRHANARDLLVTVTFADPLATWLEQRIFHPSMRNRTVPTYQLFVVASDDWRDWQARFAERTLRQWAEGADVWLRQGALLDRPDAVLRWVEGDNPNLHWRVVPESLRALVYDRRTDLPEGFARVMRSEDNRRVLERWAKDGASGAGTNTTRKWTAHGRGF